MCVLYCQVDAMCVFFVSFVCCCQCVYMYVLCIPWWVLNKRQQKQIFNRPSFSVSVSFSFSVCYFARSVLLLEFTAFFTLWWLLLLLLLCVLFYFSGWRRLFFFDFTNLFHQRHTKYYELQKHTKILLSQRIRTKKNEQTCALETSLRFNIWAFGKYNARKKPTTKHEITFKRSVRIYFTYRLLKFNIRFVHYGFFRVRFRVRLFRADLHHLHLFRVDRLARFLFNQQN